MLIWLMHHRVWLGLLQWSSKFSCAGSAAFTLDKLIASADSDAIADHNELSVSRVEDGISTDR